MKSNISIALIPLTGAASRWLEKALVVWNASSVPLTLRKDRDGIATLTLNRPNKQYNAPSLALIEALIEMLGQLTERCCVARAGGLRGERP